VTQHGSRVVANIGTHGQRVVLPLDPVPLVQSVQLHDLEQSVNLVHPTPLDLKEQLRGLQVVVVLVEP